MRYLVIASRGTLYWSPVVRAQAKAPGWSLHGESYGMQAQTKTKAAETLNNSHPKKETVLEYRFGGSGTTMIACEKNGRTARLMELDPKYCDVIIKRWQEYTGKQATHAETGEVFDASRPAS